MEESKKDDGQKEIEKVQDEKDQDQIAGSSPESDSSDDVIDQLKKEIIERQARAAAYPGPPSSHTSQMRQNVTGKIFKKCKSATFQIDGATYTIGIQIMYIH